jgi:hypothetical protein
MPAGPGATKVSGEASGSAVPARGAAGPRCQGDGQLEAAVLRLHLLEPVQRHRDLLSGEHVRDGGREQVGPALLHEGGGPPFGLGRLVGLLRLQLLPHLAHDAAIADLHGETVHRRLLGQGEGVERFDGAAGAVHEPLDQPAPHHGAGDRDLHVGVEHGQRGESLG